MRYAIILAIAGWFILSHLIREQDTVMYQYFVEKEPSYYVRVESMARLICLDFQKNLTSDSIEKVKQLLDKYNGSPSLAVDFLYENEKGETQSALKGGKESKLVKPEYSQSITIGRLKGKLLVYDLTSQFRKKFGEYERISNITRLVFILTLALLLLILIFREYTVHVEGEKRTAESQKRAAESKAIRDGLTGLFNQKYFKNLLVEEIKRSYVIKRAMSLVMCDIDHFKKLNDTYGHLAGDKVLKKVADIIKESVRTYDIVARYGGEEFAIILLGSILDERLDSKERHKNLMEKTIIAAQRIKDNLQNTPIDIGDKTINITMSMGISLYDGSIAHNSENFIKEADSALYQSKENGRNRITIFEEKT